MNESNNGVSTEEKKKPKRGIYLLPNLFTTAGLFSGFYAIVNAMSGHFEHAAIAIFIAMIMDMLDGRVARLTNTTSEFGVQYDSLADMVSFGLAPSLVIYAWSLQSMGKLGWLAAFVYAAGAALRLARFNTQVGTADKRFFQGLPSPAAAAVVAGLVWISVDNQLTGEDMRILALILTLLAGLAMVSNFRYYSFKQIDLKGKVPFFAMLIMVSLFVLVSLDPPQVLFGIFLAYMFSGLIMTIWGIRQKRQQRKQDSGADSGAS